jgi:preprotein translocase subunit SecE
VASDEPRGEEVSSEQRLALKIGTDSDEAGMSTTDQKVKTNSELPERSDKPARQRPEWLEELIEYPARLQKFIADVRAEMKLVVWPSRTEVVNTTMVVIMTTILFAVFLWLVDKGSERAVSLVLKTFSH